MQATQRRSRPSPSSDANTRDPETPTTSTCSSLRSRRTTSPRASGGSYRVFTNGSPGAQCDPRGYRSRRRPRGHADVPCFRADERRQDDVFRSELAAGASIEAAARVAGLDPRRIPVRLATVAPAILAGIPHKQLVEWEREHRIPTGTAAIAAGDASGPSVASRPSNPSRLSHAAEPLAALTRSGHRWAGPVKLEISITHGRPRADRYPDRRAPRRDHDDGIERWLDVREQRIISRSPGRDPRPREARPDPLSTAPERPPPLLRDRTRRLGAN